MVFVVAVEVQTIAGSLFCFLWLEAKPCHGEGLGARSGMGGKIGGGKMSLF